MTEMRECGRCGTGNPPAHDFCSKCGEPLGGAMVPVPDLDALIAARVDALLSSQLKSRELVEATVEEDIAGRVVKAVKWVGALFALPALLLAGAFGLWGFYSVRDVNQARAAVSESALEARKAAIDMQQAAADEIDEMRAAAREVQLELGELLSRSEQASRELEERTARFAGLDRRLAELAEAQRRVEALERATETWLGKEQQEWREQKALVGQLKNLRYRVLITYGGARDGDGVDRTEKLWKLLVAQGFRIERDDILPGPVTEDEILHYDRATRPAVTEISQALAAEPDLRGLRVRLIEDVRGREYDIQIQLRAREAEGQGG